MGLRIGIDCDGVLRNLIPCITESIKETHPQHADKILLACFPKNGLFSKFLSNNKCFNYLQWTFFPFTKSKNKNNAKRKNTPKRSSKIKRLANSRYICFEKHKKCGRTRRFKYIFNL